MSIKVVRKVIAIEPKKNSFLNQSSKLKLCISKTEMLTKCNEFINCGGFPIKAKITGASFKENKNYNDKIFKFKFDLEITLNNNEQIQTAVYFQDTEDMKTKELRKNSSISLKNLESTLAPKNSELPPKDDTHSSDKELVLFFIKGKSTLTPYDNIETLSFSLKKKSSEKPSGKENLITKKFFIPTLTTSKNEIISNVSNSNLNYEKILEKKTKKMIYNIVSEREFYKDLPEEKVEIYGIIKKILEVRKAFVCKLKSLVGPNSIKVIINKKHTFFNMNKLSAGKVIYASFLKKNVSQKLTIYLTSTAQTKITILFDEDNKTSKFALSDLYKYKLTSFISLITPTIIRYQLDFIVKITEIVDVYISKGSNGVFGIKATVYVEDGTIEAKCFIYHYNIAEKLFLFDKKDEKFFNTLRTFDEYFRVTDYIKRNEKKIKMILLNQFYIRGVPFSSLTSKFNKSGEDFLEVYSKDKDKNSELYNLRLKNGFINGEIAPGTGIESKNFNLAKLIPFLKIKEASIIE